MGQRTNCGLHVTERYNIHPVRKKANLTFIKPRSNSITLRGLQEKVNAVLIVNIANITVSTELRLKKYIFL
jgi:hypothetical protein